MIAIITLTIIISIFWYIGDARSTYWFRRQDRKVKKKVFRRIFNPISRNINKPFDKIKNYFSRKTPIIFDNVDKKKLNEHITIYDFIRDNVAAAYHRHYLFRKENYVHHPKGDLPFMKKFLSHLSMTFKLKAHRKTGKPKLWIGSRWSIPVSMEDFKSVKRKKDVVNIMEKKKGFVKKQLKKGRGVRTNFEYYINTFVHHQNIAPPFKTYYSKVIELMEKSELSTDDHVAKQLFLGMVKSELIRELREFQRHPDETTYNHLSEDELKRLQSTLFSDSIKDEKVFKELVEALYKEYFDNSFEDEDNNEDNLN